MRSRMSSERRGGIATGPALLVARYFKPLISETPSARKAGLGHRRVPCPPTCLCCQLRVR